MILDEIAARTKERVAELKRFVPAEVIRREAEAMGELHKTSFQQALRQKDIAFICEVKKASPSKGVIAAEFPYVQIAKDYEDAGAAAVSVLSEPYYFQGSSEYVREIAARIQLPVLRKDFTVDSYQIYEAKTLGASAVLLICALLPTPVLKEYLAVTETLGMSALVEAHTGKEVESALEAGAKIIGVNNRNLQTFEVDITASIRLRKLVPPEILFVSESGMKTPEDIRRLRDNGTDAVLIGETLMRSADKKKELAVLKGTGA